MLVKGATGINFIVVLNGAQRSESAGPTTFLADINLDKLFTIARNRWGQSNTVTTCPGSFKNTYNHKKSIGPNTKLAGSYERWAFYLPIVIYFNIPNII